MLKANGRVANVSRMMITEAVPHVLIFMNVKALSFMYTTRVSRVQIIFLYRNLDYI